MSLRDRRDATLPHRTAAAAASGRHAGPPVRRRRRLRALLVVALVAAAALPGTVAYAWWSGSGSGSGSASAATLQALVVSGDAVTPDATLLPGATGSVSMRVHNPNAFPVRLVAVAKDAAIAVSGDGSCTAENSRVSFADQTGLSIIVAAGVDWQDIELPASVSMVVSSDDHCQGRSFTVPVKLTVRTP